MSVMNKPSTVAPNGESVIMPLAKTHATPAKGTTPRTRQSTRIIARKLPPLFFVRIFFAAFTPKLVACAMDEHIFQRRLAHRNCLNLAWKRLDYIRHKPVPTFLLDAHLIAHDRCVHLKTRPNMFGQ